MAEFKAIVRKGENARGFSVFLLISRRSRDRDTSGSSSESDSGFVHLVVLNLGIALTAVSIVGRTDMAMIEDVLTIMSSFFCICKK